MDFGNSALISPQAPRRAFSPAGLTLLSAVHMQTNINLTNSALVATAPAAHPLTRFGGVRTYRNALSFQNVF